MEHVIDDDDDDDDDGGNGFGGGNACHLKPIFGDFVHRGFSDIFAHKFSAFCVPA